jgi:hypothetical protein
MSDGVQSPFHQIRPEHEACLSLDVCDNGHSNSLAAAAAAAADAADADADAAAAAADAADAVGSCDSSVHLTHMGSPAAAQRHNSAVAAAAAAVPHYRSLPHAFNLAPTYPSTTSGRDRSSPSILPRGSLVAAGCTPPLPPPHFTPRSRLLPSTPFIIFNPFYL